MSPREHKLFNDTVNGKPVTEGQTQVEEYAPPFRVPPTSAIAGVLIRDWAEGKLGFTSKL